MMIVDAGVVLALVLPLPFSTQATRRVYSLRQNSVQLVAPALMEYEICSALRRAVSRGLLETQHAAAALELVEAVNIQPITPAISLHRRALSWSARLGQSKAYDAHYLALAEEMGCGLLTTDSRLAHAAHSLGASWVENVSDL